VPDSVEEERGRGPGPEWVGRECCCQGMVGADWV